MKYIIFFFIIFNTHAKLDITPGQWGQKATIFLDDVNMTEQISGLLASIPKAQQQMIKDMLKAQGQGDILDMLGEKKTCITEKMIANPEKIAEIEKDCKNKIIKQTNKELEMSITCTNGMAGKMHIKTNSQKSYTGNFEGSTKDKKNIKGTFVGTFIKKECK